MYTKLQPADGDKRYSEKLYRYYEKLEVKAIVKNISENLIDILDPLIVAKTIALTEEFKYIKIEDIESELRDGRRGTGARKKVIENKKI